MPYITQDRRTEIDPLIEQLAEAIDKEERAGELNYAFTRLLLRTMPATKYVVWNESLGVLEAVKQELYRRAIAAYEDEKIADNGDVQELQRRNS